LDSAHYILGLGKIISRKKDIKNVNWDRNSFWPLFSIADRKLERRKNSPRPGNYEEQCEQNLQTSPEGQLFPPVAMVAVSHTSLGRYGWIFLLGLDAKF